MDQGLIKEFILTFYIIMIRNACIYHRHSVFIYSTAGVQGRSNVHYYYLDFFGWKYACSKLNNYSVCEEFLKRARDRIIMWVSFFVLIFFLLIFDYMYNTELILLKYKSRNSKSASCTLSYLHNIVNMFVF